MKKLWLFISVLICSTSVWAEVPFECDYAGTGGAFASCAGDNLAKQKKRLNQSYDILFNNLPDDEAKRLEAAQKIWLKYRDADCGKFLQESPSAESGPILYCQLELVYYRAEILSDRVKMRGFESKTEIKPEFMDPSNGFSMVAPTQPAESIKKTGSDAKFEMLKVAGQSKDAVKKLLGEPNECHSNKYGEKCGYKLMSTDIVFIDGKADWITINELEEADYDKSTLKWVGLEPSEPDFANDNVMRWENKQGLLEVSLFPAGEKVFYAYVKAKTK